MEGKEFLTQGNLPGEGFLPKPQHLQPELCPGVESLTSLQKLQFKIIKKELP